MVTPAVDAKVLVVYVSSKKKDVGDCPACRSYIGWWWRYYALGDTFSWAALGPVVVVEQTMKVANYLNIIAPLHGICLPNWKWNLPEGQHPMSQGSDCVGVIRGAY
ncbi:hypothetical protein AVEN_195828-1 [Araneus ventricosus]|uniref:Uncharacterized protein n=1 Tax=Araneus ventricosus TaxID=182803 RepID=A0A4Y2F2J7_ARAVE|nr:hypothetical protein AVEN_195828-1 [Araneus ventricosus]